ncbi:hypothetical protein [Actinoallomurus sp. CA-142502]|uniref:hypothetical protein n=1 Tax=Actinoallomurus sp. CA-142502 TaxID=3239885 RepID=UPI003D9235C9
MRSFTVPALSVSCLAVSLWLVGCGSARPASAQGSFSYNGYQLVAGDGNGTGNRNVWIVKSPTINNGIQMILGGNAGGVFSSQAAICKRKRACRINQKIHAR